MNRKTHRAYTRIRENNFSINGLLGFDLHGKTVGVIGTGKIGQVFMDICRGFGMDVIAYDPYPKEGSGIQYVTLNELYKRADVISLHCPLTRETHHLVNEESIEMMKDRVVILNTSRGGLVDTEALIEGLKSGKVAGAGLDVYEEESHYFFEDFSNDIISDDALARLLTFPNVLLTSHQGFFTEEAIHNIATTTLQNIKDYEEGKDLKNEVCYQCQKGACPKKAGERCF